MTANAMSGDRELCLAAGMNDHIGKPIDIDQLFATLARWVTPRNAASDASGPLSENADKNGGALLAIAGLDLAQAMRRLGGNSKLMRKLVLRFAQTQPQALQRIAAALDAGDTETAAREAHTTKGLAGNIGATAVLERAEAVEKAIKHGQQADLPQALQSLKETLSEVLSAIAQSLAETTEGGSQHAAPASLDRLQFAADLQRFAALLADDDSEAAKMVEAIAQQLSLLGMSTAGAQIAQSVARYDFEMALERVREAAVSLDISLG
jgi:two-component system sensor histidine kinase/response regulator